MSLIYAGIGPRDTPDEITKIFRALGKNMAERGHLLRSGGSGKADDAFEEGCNEGKGQKEIYFPWPGFNKRLSNYDYIRAWPSKEAQDLAAEHHPNWGECSRDAMLLLSRNMNILQGWHFEKKADLVITWQHPGKTRGGTFFTVNVARAFNIPVFDLADEKAFDALDNFPGI